MIGSGTTLSLTQPLWTGSTLLLAAWAVWRLRAAGRPWIWRLVGLSSLAIALGRPVVTRPFAPDTVLLIDESGSMEGGAYASGSADDPLGPDGRLLAIRFGDTDHTPLAEAIDGVRAGFPDIDRLAIYSDGGATGEDPVAAAWRSGRSGLPVDVVMPTAAEAPAADVAVIGLDVPQAIRRGDVGQALVTLASASPTSATLEVRLEDRTILRRAERWPAGESTVSVPFRAPDGAAEVRVTAMVRAEPDADRRNDELHRAVYSVAPPRVLVVGADPQTIELADRLRSRSGMRTTVVGPQRVPVRISELVRYDAIVLVDVPARGLGVDQHAALELAVTQHGIGLWMIGGRQSFNVGQWEGTTLARLAPVDLRPPPRQEREPVALLLLLDVSASMAGGDSRSAISKLDLAKEAALLAAESVGTGDRLGVVAYADEARWVVSFERVDGPAAAPSETAHALAGLSAGGGTNIGAALALGLPALAGLDAPTRHAVLLSDGRDPAADVEELRTLAAEAASVGGTLSTIAIGLDADDDVLEALARVGGGRHHVARRPADLPRLTLAESEMVSGRPELRGPIRLSAQAQHPMLFDTDVSRLPPLDGALRVGHREGATDVLSAPDGEPVLAEWPRGAGRVAAWTSDVGGRWASSWRTDGPAFQVWDRIVRRVSRPPRIRGLVAESASDVRADEARVSARIEGTFGEPMDLARVTLVVTMSEQTLRVDAPQVAPGRYGLTFPVPTERPASGGWLAAWEVRPRAGDATASVLPFAIPWSYPPELRPVVGGAARLARMAEVSGGRTLEALPSSSATGGFQDRSIWPWFVALAAMLWPADVAAQLRKRPGGRSVRIDAGRDSDRPVQITD